MGRRKKQTEQSQEQSQEPSQEAKIVWSGEAEVIVEGAEAPSAVTA